jgi:multidrug efflux system outer membrane protein
MTDRAWRLGAAAIGGAVLSGCMSLAPRYERPPAPVADTFPAADAAAAGTPAADIAWQQYFGDARLKRLIAIALAHNRDLRVAVFNIEQARAQLGLRRADEWPTIGVGANLTRQPSTDPKVGGNVSLYTVGLAVTSYELDLFGRVRNLADAAAAQFLATEESRKTVQISLIASVANTYLALLADEELLKVTRDALATREESFRLTRLKFENGASSEIDFRLAESLLESARVALAQQTRQRMLDENALVLLLGQPLPSELPPGLSVTDQQMVADLPAGIPSEVLARRPDVRAAEQQLVAAHANIGAARAAFFPRITLTGSAGTASTSLSGLFKSGSFAWTFAPQALLPIFDAGRNESNLALAKANREIALAQYERAIQTAFREVSDALAGRATLAEQVRAQQAQANAEAVRTRLAQLRYDNGVASYLDVLDAQRSLFTAQQAVVQAQALQAQTRVNLYKVLGGGWNEAPTP